MSRLLLAEARAMNRAGDLLRAMAAARLGDHPYYEVLAQELRAAARAIWQDPGPKPQEVSK